eukprot:940216-Pelagomonas_calceolata.AAC.2
MRISVWIQWKGTRGAKMQNKAAAMASSMNVRCQREAKPNRITKWSVHVSCVCAQPALSHSHLPANTLRFSSPVETCKLPYKGTSPYPMLCQLYHTHIPKQSPQQPHVLWGGGGPPKQIKSPSAKPQKSRAAGARRLRCCAMAHITLPFLVVLRNSLTLSINPHQCLTSGDICTSQAPSQTLDARAAGNAFAMTTRQHS